MSNRQVNALIKYIKLQVKANTAKQEYEMLFSDKK